MTGSTKGSMFIEEEDSVFDQKVCKYSALQALHLYFNVFQLFDHSKFDVESVHCEPASAFDAYARFRGTDSMLVHPLSQLVLYAFE